MRRSALFALAVVLSAGAATIGPHAGVAAGIYTAPIPDVPAGYTSCVDATRQMSLCPIPGYKPPDLVQPLAAQPRMIWPPLPSSEELRHREMMNKLDRIEDAIRYR